MGYSITVQWKPDSLHDYLNGLRGTLASGNNATPVHISVASFLQIPDSGVPAFIQTLQKFCLRCSVHELRFGAMSDELFSPTNVAVPIRAPCRELLDIRNEIETFCMAWGINLRHPNFRPHATIFTAKLEREARRVHDIVRKCLVGWTARSENSLEVKVLGFDMWKHGGKQAELVERFTLPTLCMCSICDRARRLKLHGCSCKICVRSMVAHLRAATLDPTPSLPPKKVRKSKRC
ncbi:hypothetical protein R3P38DRAFT_1481305 [Favolaschia claudopus]|uniref:Uncharacterized protein n=1 Tax=Favolaschia claudopus TaxID=2862362 RepID=A0AAW0DR92_9AGAR